MTRFKILIFASRKFGTFLFFQLLILGIIVRNTPLYSVILLFMLFTMNSVLAGDAKFTLSDTTLRQGTRWKLPVFLVSNSNVVQETCTIRIAIPKKRIILHDAITEPGTLYTCKQTTITFLSDGVDYKEYAITCPNPLYDSSGIALYLELEALAGMDTSATIKVLSFSIGNENQTIQQIGGKITFLDPSVIQASTEGMDINAPNPFSYTTSFTYYIGKMGNVQFFLYNAQGKLVKEFPIERKVAGRHSFTLNVDNPMDFSSGVYVIRMKTEQGLYHMSMVHKK